jgi:spore coat polysaccharide biosynthesis protein SpsF
MTKAIISIAARMASTRLPGKVMAEVGGKPILQHLVERLSRSRAEVVIANNGGDPEILDLADRLGVYCFHADLDVMDIHRLAAVWSHADFILLAGADDPFLDPALFDLVLDRLERGDVQYVKTQGWPLGMNVWGWTRAAMEDGHRLATAPDERQHVVPFWERRPLTYPAAVIRRDGPDLYDHYRLTVDNPSDLTLTQYLYGVIGATSIEAERVIRYLALHPSVVAINVDGLRGTAARDAIYDVTPVENVMEGLTRHPLSKHLDEIREHIAVERRAALAAIPEQGGFAEGRAAALLSVEQWLRYREAAR